MFKLNEDQLDAVMKCLNWYYMDSHRKQLFNIVGLAGCGKSTALKYVISALGINKNSILYTAFTGKAVSVLKIKGHNAGTIHKTFYNAKPYKNTVIFNKKKSLPSNINLIVIDEFGMVGDSMVNDILSFGIPVVTLGDNKQIGPLFEKNTFIDDMDVFLDKVMRTDDLSGILPLATCARNNTELSPGTYSRSRVIESPDELKDMLEYDKVLCWTNKTRRELNIQIRDKLGIFSKYPLKGEKISFLGNRYDKVLDYLGTDIAIVNGLECIMLEDSIILNEDQLQVKARPTFVESDLEDTYFDVICNRKIFDSYYEPLPDTKTLMMMDREQELGNVFCDFSYAITTSSSQGSEWGNVLVIDECPKFRPEYWKLLYTAITRASFSVDVLINQQR